MRVKSERYKTGERALTRTEYNKMLAVIDNVEDELMLKLAVSTGIRREDFFNIKIADIDLDQMKLTFYEAKKKRSRTVDLETDVVLLIRKHLKTFAKREKLFSFTGRSGWNHFNHWCDIAEIPRRPFHAIRGTTAKFCQAAGWPIEKTAKLLGDTIEVVQEHYNTPSADEMAEMAKEKPIA